ncbi:hypothetical protein LJC64_04555 [Ruminococcaceae bacterium OttesenSCG-928-A11]|nr:hypothetical protein [Ruminococcaceae bacterium OttesenSCG-928-A11]
MAEYYVCKYSHKYASELVYAFCQLRDVWNKPLKVMSVGCGPCTDLFALDHLQNEGRLGHIEYRGIDLNEIWRKIHRNIAHNQENNQVRFFYENVFDFIDVVNRKNWLPDLLIFQYVFSDMRKTADDTEVNGFIEHMSEFINRLPVNSYIILNDINLQNSQGGGRNYFDRLYRHLHGCDYLDCHFNNNNRQNHYHYGDEYTSNNLIWPIPNNLHQYSPFESCASAQKIIKRVR